jgi:hypothetical protein
VSVSVIITTLRLISEAERCWNILRKHLMIPHGFTTQTELGRCRYQNTSSTNVQTKHKQGFGMVPHNSDIVRVPYVLSMVP